MGVYQRGKTWWVRFVDHNGKTRRLRASTSKRTADYIDVQCKALVEAAAGGQPTPDDLAAWLYRLDPERRDRLVAWELVDARRMIAAEPLPKQLDRWHAALRARNRPEAYADRRKRDALMVFDAAGVKRWADIDPEGVLVAIRGMKAAKNTIAHRLSAVRQFTRWMSRNRYAPSDPLLGLVVEREQKQSRRALTEAEQALLVRSTASNGELYGMSAAARSLLYRTALETGARAGAIRRLMVRDIAPGVLRYRPGASNKGASPKPIRPALEAALRAHAEGKDADAPLFDLPSEFNLARMLRHDAKAAGIQTKGLDFHSLRHTFGTTLARQGTHLKTLMNLMDHTDPKITMRLYSHAFPEDEGLAVERLPDLGPAMEPARGRAAS